MKKFLVAIAAALCLAALPAASAFGQATTTSSLNGSVTDAQHAVVANANVIVRNTATSAEFNVQTADNGTFTVPALPAGTYTVTITAQGFKQALVQDVKVELTRPASVNVMLEVGAVTDVVTITGGGEVLQSANATISSTITGRQVIELPFATRDALQLALVQPGTQTATVPRASTINGLPKASVNITLDGINVLDNLLKSSDGFFTSTQAKADAVGEMTLSSAVPGAESGAGGASQIRFSTKSGTNDFHGGGFWQHRNTALNSNYYFNNIDGLPRDFLILNQFGGHMVGPVMKNKLFFFVNYEEFRLPQS